MLTFDPTLPEQNKEDKKVFEKIILPAGEYDFVVKRAVMKPSKAGNPMIQIIITVTDKDKEVDIFDHLLEAMKYKLKHFCETCGLDKEFESGSLDPDFLGSARGRCILAIEDHPTYGTKNVVKDYVTPKDNKTTVEANPDVDIFNDDIPF